MKNSLHALNCTEASQSQLDSVMKQEMARVSYVARDGLPTKDVRFEFNLSRPAMENVFVSVTSQKSRRSIYRGDFVPEFVVRAGADLFEDEGYDTFKFVFINPASRQICAWEQEAGGRLWRTDTPISIEFLPQREMDKETGTPIAWKLKAKS